MGRLTIAGSSFDIGEGLGRIARPLARRIASEVRRNAYCRNLRETEMTALLAQVRERFPHLWEELRGLSAGMDLDIEEAFLWNCLQDRLASAASSTVVINRLGYRLILHKRELQSPFGARSRVLEVRPEDKPGFLGLVVPGCVPGTTFAANHAGIAHVADAVPDEATGGGLPGFIVGRAVLDAGSLAEAIDIVMDCDRYDSAQHILASTREFVTVAIAATPSERTVAPIPNRHWQTNHFADRQCAQETVAYRASGQRYAALSALMGQLPHYPTEDDMLSLLERKGEPEIDASAIQPKEDDVGTVLIKLASGRIDVRLFRAADPARHSHIVRVQPDKHPDHELEHDSGKP